MFGGRFLRKSTVFYKNKNKGVRFYSNTQIKFCVKPYTNMFIFFFVLPVDMQCRYFWLFFLYLLSSIVFWLFIHFNPFVNSPSIQMWTALLPVLDLCCQQTFIPLLVSCMQLFFITSSCHEFDCCIELWRFTARLLGLKNLVLIC